MKHIKENIFTYLFVVIFILASVAYPDFQYTVYGALGWFAFLLTTLIGFMTVLILIFGGSMTYETEGLIPKLVRLFKKK